ncbi:MAG: acyltransferase family protein [Henriciella sp.]|nr:acyltransferase family protein [Henriciella sp.]
MKYRPDIDGLRTVAVVPVVLYHAGVPGFSGGFIGVDVFFVISGFLITRILYDEMVEKRFSILHFYERRARRILPALFAVMLACLAAGWFLLSPEDYSHMARSAVSALVFLSNIWFWQNSGGYFDGATDYLPLLHTWSLAVEEQFYILFPLYLLIILRWGKEVSRSLTWALVLGSLLFAAWITPQMPSASFYLLPTRFWELGLGSLLALGLATVPLSQWVRELMAGIGLLLILFAVVFYNSATSFPGIAALPPVLGAAALIWAGASGSSLVGKALSWRPMVFVGLLSYSLYLWHWPIMAFARNWLMSSELPEPWQVATIAASFVAAWLSYKYVETPFRAGRGRPMTQSRVFTLSGIGTATLAIMAVGVIFTQGVEKRFEPAQLDLLASTQETRDNRDCWGTREPEQLCTFGDEETNRNGRWLLWGDSHAGALFPAIQSVAATEGVLLDFGVVPACGPLPGLSRSDRDFGARQRCGKFNDSMLDHILSRDLYDTVILHARWPLYVEGKRFGPEQGQVAVLGDRDSATFAKDPSGNAILVENTLTELVDKIVAGGARVVIIGPVPELPWDVEASLKAEILFNRPASFALNVESALRRQARSEEIFRRLTDRDGVNYIPITSTLCQDICPTHTESTAWYEDSHHLTEAGALSLIVPIVSSALSGASTTLEMD